MAELRGRSQKSKLFMNPNPPLSPPRRGTGLATPTPSREGNWQPKTESRKHSRSSWQRNERQGNQTTAPQIGFPCHSFPCRSSPIGFALFALFAVHSVSWFEPKRGRAALAPAVQDAAGSPCVTATSRAPILDCAGRAQRRRRFRTNRSEQPRSSWQSNERQGNETAAPQI
jgi:hypothetical protein